MNAFFEWIKAFRKKHLYPSYEPSAKQGWRAALEEVLKQTKGEEGAGLKLRLIIAWIKEELNE